MNNAEYQSGNSTLPMETRVERARVTPQAPVAAAVPPSAVEEAVSQDFAQRIERIRTGGAA